MKFNVETSDENLFIICNFDYNRKKAMGNLHEALHAFLCSSRVYQPKYESERKIFCGNLVEKT
jgi:hypothetical protein